MGSISLEILVQRRKSHRSLSLFIFIHGSHDAGGRRCSAVRCSLHNEVAVEGCLRHGQLSSTGEKEDLGYGTTISIGEERLTRVDSRMSEEVVSRKDDRAADQLLEHSETIFDQLGLECRQAPGEGEECSGKGESGKSGQLFGRQRMRTRHCFCRNA